VQKSQAEVVSETGMAILRSLMARPLWLVGVALQVLGLLFHAFALTEAPITVVQPIIASGIGFLVLFAALILRERPSPRELLGMGLAVSGVTLLAYQIQGPVVLAPLDADDFAYAVVSAAALAAILLAFARSRLPSGVRAALIGGAAGVGQGMSDAMNRLAGAWFAPRGWVPPTWVLCAALALLFGFGLQGFVAAQNAFQRYRANTVVPCIVTAQLFVPSRWRSSCSDSPDRATARTRGSGRSRCCSCSRGSSGSRARRASSGCSPTARAMRGTLARRRRDLPAQRRALDATHERRAHARDRARELGAHEPRAQLLEHGADLEAREVRAQADVLAAPEADVVVGLPVDPEHVAVGKISSSRFADG
jgi:multidrug transporter EmrE-like cation transporter